jgi:hypothetical protein
MLGKQAKFIPAQLNAVSRQLSTFDNGRGEEYGIPDCGIHPYRTFGRGDIYTPDDLNWSIEHDPDAEPFDMKGFSKNMGQSGEDDERTVRDINALNPFNVSN